MLLYFRKHNLSTTTRNFDSQSLIFHGPFTNLVQQKLLQSNFSKKLTVVNGKILRSKLPVGSLIEWSWLRKSHYQVIDGSEMRSFNCSFPHTAHCLASGEIMISTMGDKEENGKGDFVLIDSKSLKVTGECGRKGMLVSFRRMFMSSLGTFFIRTSICVKEFSREHKSEIC